MPLGLEKADRQNEHGYLAHWALKRRYLARLACVCRESWRDTVHTVTVTVPNRLVVVYLSHSQLTHDMTCIKLKQTVDADLGFVNYLVA